MGQGVVRNKDNVNKSTLFRKWFFKPQTSHFHRRLRRSNVNRGISARPSKAKTHLCDREMPCGTHQTYDNTEVRIKAAFYGVGLRKQILNEHVKIDKIYHWTNSSTVQEWLQAAHKKQQVFVANRAAEILETHQWINGDTSNVSKTLPTSQPEEWPSKDSRNPYV